jgi:hypothetical protein
MEWLPREMPLSFRSAICFISITTHLNTLKYVRSICFGCDLDTPNRWLSIWWLHTSSLVGDKRASMGGWITRSLNAQLLMQGLKWRSRSKSSEFKALLFGVESKTRFSWVVVWLAIEYALLVLGWRFKDRHGIIWDEEECGGVALVGEDQRLQGCMSGWFLHCVIWLNATDMVWIVFRGHLWWWWS